MGRVVVVGSVNVDQVAQVERHPKPGETVLALRHDRLAGGKGANQAVAAASAGAEVLMVGCVGDDDPGRAYAARLAARGVDVTHLSVSPGEPTGAAYIVVDDQRENTIVVVPGANAAIEAGWPDRFPELHPDDVVVLQLEIPLGAVRWAAERAHQAGARVVLNLAPYADLPTSLLDLADPVVANEHEALLLADSGATASSLLVTMGRNGAVWDGEVVPAVQLTPDQVQDTTGAGDAFVGALAAALARGAGRIEALEAAAAAGAEAVRHTGAQPDGRLDRLPPPPAAGQGEPD